MGIYKRVYKGAFIVGGSHYCTRTYRRTVASIFLFIRFDGAKRELVRVYKRLLLELLEHVFFLDK